MADPVGRAVKGVGLRPLACWDCEFESGRSHGCLSVVSVVYCRTDPSSIGLLPSVVCLNVVEELRKEEALPH